MGSFDAYDIAAQAKEQKTVKNNPKQAMAKEFIS